MNKRKWTDRLWNNKLYWTVILLGLAAILSLIKLMELPQGGSVTYFSWLFLWLVTFFYGPRYGLFASLVFSVIKFGVVYITGEYINYNPLALILEYPIANGVFFLGGYIKSNEGKCTDDSDVTKETFKLFAGYLIGMFGLFVFYVISAVFCYPPDREGFIPNLLFCMVYDGSYLAIECVMTLLLLCVPVVREAIYYVKYVATHDLEDETMDSF